MKTIKIISVVLALSLLPLTVFAAPVSEKVTDEIPYAAHDAKTSPYTYNKMEIYTESEAKSSGVPDGCTGHVMMLESNMGAAGITVDFSDRNIPLSIVKALHMRVLYPKETKEVRISIDSGVSWELRHVASKPGEWEDVKLDASGMTKLVNDDGTLGKFGFGFRYTNNNKVKAYIDCIYVEYKDTDSVPPVITYDGPTDITTTEGKPFVINATAYDENEKRSIPIVFEWSDGSLDKDGNVLKGDHVCYLTATDGFGNRAEIKLNVTVKEKDTQAPKINFSVPEINTVTGCIPALTVTANDNEDDVTVKQIWSDGALDNSGRLTEGTHTLTLLSEDLTGNKTEFTVKVNVYESYKTDKTLIEE